MSLRLAQATKHSASRLKKALKHVKASAGLLEGCPIYEKWIRGNYAFEKQEWEAAWKMFKQVLADGRAQQVWGQRAEVYVSYCEYQMPELLSVAGMSLDDTKGLTRSSSSRSKAASGSSPSLIDALPGLKALDLMPLLTQEPVPLDKAVKAGLSADAHGKKLVQALMYANHRQWSHSAWTCRRLLSSFAKEGHNEGGAQDRNLVAGLTRKLQEIALVHATCPSTASISMDIPWPCNQTPSVKSLPAKPAFYDIAFGAICTVTGKLDGAR